MKVTILRRQHRFTKHARLDFSALFLYLLLFLPNYLMGSPIIGGFHNGL
jgi:hypothetical protein